MPPALVFYSYSALDIWILDTINDNYNPPLNFPSLTGQTHHVEQIQTVEPVVRFDIRRSTEENN